MQLSKIEDIVISALIESLEENDVDYDKSSISSDWPLIGTNALLDSIGLVTMLVNIEQTLSDDYDIEITIADEKAMSMKRSPFRNIKTITEFINSKIE